MPHDHKTAWKEYCATELRRVIPILAELGYALEDEQPHLGGERYLMQAVTTESGQKLILVGYRVSDDKRVIIKTSSDESGKRELRHDRLCRAVLEQINFAYQVFASPEELVFIERDNCLISIQAFIEQEQPFLDRSIEEQFNFALRAFKAQEGAHATTYEHEQLITKTFSTRDAKGYIDTFKDFLTQIKAHSPVANEIVPLLEGALHMLEKNQMYLDQYGRFLTHTDFVPHNFRIVDGTIYMLDHSSLRFGNKYEGWARFLNFMALHNPELERILVTYVRDNRTPEESIALQLMRVYRLGEIIWYYTRNLARSTENLQELNLARSRFWSRLLESVIQNIELPSSVLNEYRELRDRLRSEDEKQRQLGLH